MRTINAEKDTERIRRKVHIVQDEKRANILHIDGREVNKENYPDGFDFRLIAGTGS